MARILWATYSLYKCGVALVFMKEEVKGGDLKFDSAGTGDLDD